MPDPLEVGRGLSEEAKRVLVNRRRSPTFRADFVSCYESGEVHDKLISLNLAERFSASRVYVDGKPKLLASLRVTPLGRQVAEALSRDASTEKSE